MPVMTTLPGVHPVQVWTDQIEEQAKVQLQNTASLPFVFHHVAAMPDVHLGIGATIGSVIATKGAISPAAVGVDLGCGMSAVSLNMTADQLPDGFLPKLRANIERSVPVGFSQHRDPTDQALEYIASQGETPSVIGDREIQKASCQLGTLGGGNHFIELSVDTVGGLWFVLHSGSRNVGNEVAKRHIETAKGLMKRYFIDLADPDLAYLVEGTEEFNRYVDDIEWCQNYAAANRRVMMDAVLRQFSFTLGKSGDIEGLIGDTSVSCHHNYVDREHHYGQDVLVTRKGAIRARAGDMGIIPGSMGAKSYIVRGLGNPESFNSAPHGAGRRMGRKEAERQFTTKDLEEQTAGVECRKDRGVVDEIPSAYKDVDDVVLNKSSDLVEVVSVLKAVMCVKG